MRNGDLYQHYKDVEYHFDCIALPISIDENTDMRYLTECGVALDAHTPDDMEIQELQLYLTSDGITLIAAPDPHVIYQSEKDYNTDKVWARRVDDFFGYVTKGTDLYKRFVYKGRDK